MTYRFVAPLKVKKEPRAPLPKPEAKRFHDGKAAWAAGILLNACPYDCFNQGVDYGHWRAGWQEADTCDQRAMLDQEQPD